MNSRNKGKVGERPEWRPIPRYAGKYEAGSDGSIRNASTGYVLSSNARNDGGYIVVRPSTGRNSRTRFVHILVAEAFIGPKPDGLDVNHINGDKADNRPANLEYVTRSQNMMHAQRTGLVDVAARRTACALSRSTLDIEDVRQIRSLLADGADAKSVAARFGVRTYVVNNIRSGRRWAWVA